MRVIRSSSPGAGAEIEQLLQRLGAQGQVVSPRGRELTEKVFAEALPPARVVERVCDDVRNDGLQALLRYTELLDGAKLTRETVRVSAAELSAAHAAADAAFLQTIRRVRDNVLAFQSRLLSRD